MARHISVCRKSDLDFLRTLPPHPSDSREFGRWLEECEARWLYFEPLGSEGAIRIYWSNPAIALGLPLIADIYGRGFVEGIEWSDEELDLVEIELMFLEEHWLEANFEEELLNYLLERKQYLLEAIAIARKNDGVVDIG